MDIVKLKADPQVAALVRLVSKKQSAMVRRGCARVTLSGTYWDGGSRSEYYLVHVASRQVKPMPNYSPPQFGGPREDPVVQIPEGHVVIEAGTFCGRPSTPTVYFPD